MVHSKVSTLTSCNATAGLRHKTLLLSDSELPHCAQVLQFAHRVIGVLAEVPACAEQALQMFLTSALAASEEARLEIIAYEFFEQARDASSCILSRSRPHTSSVAAANSDTMYSDAAPKQRCYNSNMRTIGTKHARCNSIFGSRSSA